jgi:YgiT-type zinc finger domain-containing protein
LICLICRQAEIVDGLTSITFERREMKIRVDNVPAYMCPSCGEAYVEEDVAVQLFRNAEEMSRAGKLNDVIEYNGISFR